MKGVADLRLRILRYPANDAYRMFNLPLHHADPFARRIIVQALAENRRGGRGKEGLQATK